MTIKVGQLPAIARAIETGDFMSLPKIYDKFIVPDPMRRNRTNTVKNRKGMQVAAEHAAACARVRAAEMARKHADDMALWDECDAQIAALANWD